MAEQIPIAPDAVVLDTCVLLDLLLAERPRHSQAVKLAQALQSSARQVLIPAHAYFELVGAVIGEHHRSQRPLTVVGKRDALFPFETVIVSIDLKFVQEYLVASLSEGKLIKTAGGDMIFAAIALKHDLVLVSEDKRLRADPKSHDAC